jgi:hypothetical protein
VVTKTPKRPRDPNQLAKMIVDIATGEDDVSRNARPLDVSAARAGIKGGKARAKALTPSERSEIASVAAQARWKKGV